MYRKSKAATLSLMCVVCLGVPPVNAASISYDEAIDGDLPGNARPDPRPILHFDVGLNTVKGTGRIVLRDEEDFELQEFDWDELLFTIAPGQQLTNVTLHFALTKEQNSSWTTGIIPRIGTHIPPVTEAGIGAEEFVTLSSVYTPADSSPVSLFSHALPLATPEEGLYSYGYGVGVGPGLDRLPGDAEIEYDYITIFKVKAVPIPPPLPLFATGLLALVGMARRKAA